MTDALYTLAAWFSPAYPVGAFSYSHGFEQAISAGAITDAATLEAWIADCVEHGAGRSDAILAAAAWREPANDGVAEFAEALAPSRERHLETMAQGEAFATTTAAAWGGVPDGADAVLPYPIAVGRAAAAHGLPLEETLVAYLHGFAANLASVGVRLVPLGQTDGQRVVAALRPLCRRIAREAATAKLDAIGTSTIMADIAAMRHETQTVRLFRS